MAKIEKISANPLYKQLITNIKTDIEQGVYPLDSKIPSEAELCDKYGVSRITVRKALEELSEQGLLIRKQGKGTFVSTPVETVEIKAVNSFTDICKSMNKTPISRVIGARSIKANKEDVEKLHVPEDSRVIEIDRIRYADGEAVIIERNHFPFVYSYLLESDLKGSLYGLLRGYGIEPTKASHDVSIIMADENKANLLAVPVGTPLLFVHEVIYDQKNRPLHTSHEYIRGDKFVFRI